MRFSTLTSLLLVFAATAFAQQAVPTKTTGSPTPKNGNIYTIKQLFLEQVLHNPTEKEEDEADNDLARFNRWFNLMEPRTYPEGNIPAPEVLLRAQQEVRQASKMARKSTAADSTHWLPLGPNAVPANYNGVGRVNCIVFSPKDTGTLFVGTACGGVWVSHNSGATWKSNSDNFPSMSIADIAVNPKHPDTVYAATGDGYGYENGSYNIFWGGLYSAGIMMSTDTGNTWTTTGLSFLQTDTNIVQKLLIHPNKTGLLLAATRYGLQRSLDAGATWSVVTTGHIYSMAFRPGRPDTVYAINNHNLIVSYNAGTTWSTLYAGINSSDDRCSIAVSPASPNSIWVLNAANNLMRSYNGGISFTPTTSPNATATFYGYYDRVLAVSPTDSNYVLAFGKEAARTTNGGISWGYLDAAGNVHVDFHAVAINPLNTNIIYVGNDGGIECTRNKGTSFRNVAKGLTISQIYRISTSRQNPYVMMCGLQDNGSFFNDGTQWLQSNAPSGDGMDNAIHPSNDDIQINSWQYGHFYTSLDHGMSFNALSLPSGIAGTGQWVSPVAFNPRNPDTVYFGFKTIYASYDAGLSASPLTSTTLFTNGATHIAVAPSNPIVLYASDYARIMRSSDGGATWTNISAGIPGLAKMDIAVDYNDPMKVYLTVSGYAAASKVFKSTDGGATWSNFSTGLPNVPANCIAVDSSTPGAVFVGTDLGVYYRDDSVASWTLYNTGLPNVIIDDIDINYTNYKVRAATYGRGVWECKLKKNPPPPSHVTVNELTKAKNIQLFPNPTSTTWKVLFANNKPADYTIKVMDATGKVVHTQTDKEIIDAAALAKGTYFINITSGDWHETIKAVRY